MSVFIEVLANLLKNPFENRDPKLQVIYNFIRHPADNYAKF